MVKRHTVLTKFAYLFVEIVVVSLLFIQFYIFKSIYRELYKLIIFLGEWFLLILLDIPLKSHPVFYNLRSMRFHRKVCKTG